ncbi:unannotated protein [freshwater metagenome]|uniref:Unannotated protein n=1 Tax=freshwater metagenome TaxID=449393 RepID=A0A6J7NZN2_9ZZZZ
MGPPRSTARRARAPAMAFARFMPPPNKAPKKPPTPPPMAEDLSPKVRQYFPSTLFDRACPARCGFRLRGIHGSTGFVSVE